MKTLKSIFALSLLLGLGFASCNKDDNSISPENPVHLPAEEVVNPMAPVVDPFH